MPVSPAARGSGLPHLESLKDLDLFEVSLFVRVPGPGHVGAAVHTRENRLHDWPEGRRAGESTLCLVLPMVINGRWFCKSDLGLSQHCGNGQVKA